MISGSRYIGHKGYQGHTSGFCVHVKAPSCFPSFLACLEGAVLKSPVWQRVGHGVSAVRYLPSPRHCCVRYDDIDKVGVCSLMFSVVHACVYMYMYVSRLRVVSSEPAKT
jgi:hypothetical protein